MKDFFGSENAGDSAFPPADRQLRRVTDEAFSEGRLGRIAVYDSLTVAPRVEDVVASSPSEFIEQLSTRAYRAAKDQGGRLPYTLIREIVENFIHARFSEVIVTVLDDGNTMRFSDQGPGIPDKTNALEPGFSTATAAMKQIIRGVGSGLPIVKESLSFSDGSLSIEDNLGSGTVVTLRVQPEPAQDPPPETPVRDDASPILRLSVRQKQVLSLVMELGSVGPSAVAGELKVAVSTAYRDLAFLEEVGLVATDESGKRALTEEGLAFLDGLFRQ